MSIKALRALREQVNKMREADMMIKKSPPSLQEMMAIQVRELEWQEQHQGEVMALAYASGVRRAELERIADVKLWNANHFDVSVLVGNGNKTAAPDIDVTLYVTSSGSATPASDASEATPAEMATPL